MEQKIYVISDLHGYYDLYLKLLEEINFSDDDLLYIIGDVCDRGPESLKIYLDIQQRSNVILLRGNHELMMQEALYEATNLDDSRYALQLWIANGGDTTIDNIQTYLRYSELSESEYQLKCQDFLKVFYDYLVSLPNYLEIEVKQQKYVLVHAGINPRYPMDKQSENDLLWIREDFYKQRGDLTKIYIFGHTPTVLLNRDGSFKVWFDETNHNKIGIDGGLACGQVGQLNCICLNDGKITVITKGD